MIRCHPGSLVIFTPLLRQPRVARGLLRRCIYEMAHTFYHEVEANTHAALGDKLGNLFGELTRADVAEAGAQRDWKHKVSASRRLLKKTEQYFPHYVEELNAYADAAGIPLLELWALSVEDELDEAGREKCTTVVTNGGKLISHNEDWDEDADEAICILRKTLAGTTLFEIYYSAVPLGGCAISINSNGYLQAINSLTQSDRQIGVPRNVIARWLSETRDVPADFEALKAIPRSSGYNHVFVNSQGEAFDMECTATRQVLARPSLPYVHTNHSLSSELEGYDGAEKGDGTFKRYVAACRLMTARMTVSELITLSSDETGGRRTSILNQDTIGRMVVDLENHIVKVGLRREKKDGWIDYPLDFLSSP